MPTVRGRGDVQRFLKGLPHEIETKLLRGAAKAGGNVIAADAKERSHSQEVGDAIVVRSSGKDGRIVVKITIPPGWQRSLGIWQEYGTTPHFIRIAAEQRQGRSVTRINDLDKAAAKVGAAGPGHAIKIGGNFVTGTVRHPGARREPFLRPALDHNINAAVAAAQGYINARVTHAGIIGNAEPEVGE